jgi:CheY-like chemotaxis protein
MITRILGRPVEILLVEDNPGDIRLTMEALKEGKMCNNVSVARDGIEALQFLRREEPYVDAPRPDLILLIPVVILTTSMAEQDILRTYDLHANCYITKPVDIDQFVHIVQSIEDFWFSIVMLATE